VRKQEPEQEKPWEKREESLKTRIAFFIGGSIVTLILVVALFASNYSSQEFLITILTIAGLILTSAIIIVVTVKVQRKKQLRLQKF